MTNWDQRFIDLAKHISTWSKDHNTKVGAVITNGHRIISVGYNGFPQGVNDDIELRYERPYKYQWTEHAERNAIYTAARFGISVLNCSLYLYFPKGGPPCPDCTRAIIQSGISEIVLQQTKPEHELWIEGQLTSLIMIKEAGIKIRESSR